MTDRRAARGEYATPAGRRRATGRSRTAPLVSVVTPFYNSAPYLRECIESVLAQSYAAWEYVLLDNCSTDGSGEIAREYARRDRRIRFVKADVHLPQLANYNRALRLISQAGVYCKMVQADDWLFPECLERMVAVAEARPGVAIVGSYLLNGGTRVRGQGLQYPARVVAGRDACRVHLLQRLSLFGTPTSVLYRSDVVRAREPFYPESSLAADSEACYEILGTRDFGFVYQVLAYAREEDDSITGRTLRFNPFLLNDLILLRKYGPVYLTPDEFESRWKTLSQEYFRFLGARALRGADPSFWEYHRRGWAAMGERLGRVRLTRYALGAVVDLALNPKATLERLLDHRS